MSILAIAGVRVTLFQKEDRRGSFVDSGCPSRHALSFADQSSTLNVFAVEA
jgi:hypothetical protein